MNIKPCKFIQNFERIDGFRVILYSLISVSKKPCVTGYKSILLHKVHQHLLRINEKHFKSQ